MDFFTPSVAVHIYINAITLVAVVWCLAHGRAIKGTLGSQGGTGGSRAHTSRRRMEAGMERPILKPIGTPAAQLDTPALVVDLALVEHNIATLHAFFQQREAKVRPHVTAHRCPALAHKQLAAGGTVGGISVTTVGEAEVFADHGFDNICVANEVVTPQKIRRLCALARRASVIVAVDNPANVRDLSAAAEAHSVTLQVVVDVHTRLHRCGVEPGQAAVELARIVHAAPHLELAGLMSYEGPILAADPAALATESRQCIQQVLDTRELLERAGLPVHMVSVGNTSNYEVAGDMAGVTEVPAGAYALLDARYGPHL